MTLEPGDPRHGTLNGYNYHRCRCGYCQGALACYRSRHRTVDPSTLRENYRIARAAGYSPDEARARRHWADPLDENR